MLSPPAVHHPCAPSLPCFLSHSFIPRPPSSSFPYPPPPSLPSRLSLPLPRWRLIPSPLPPGQAPTPPPRPRAPPHLTPLCGLPLHPGALQWEEPRRCPGFNIAKDDARLADFAPALVLVALQPWPTDDLRSRRYVRPALLPQRRAWARSRRPLFQHRFAPAAVRR